MVPTDDDTMPCVAVAMVATTSRFHLPLAPPVRSGVIVPALQELTAMPGPLGGIKVQVSAASACALIVHAGLRLRPCVATETVGASGAST